MLTSDLFAILLVLVHVVTNCDLLQHLCNGFLTVNIHFQFVVVFCSNGEGCIS